MLIDSSFLMKLDKYTFENDKKSFIRLHPDFPIELTQKVLDSIPLLNWKIL